MAKERSSKLPPPESGSASDYTTSSSEDVTEDESGTELTPALDAAILSTLGKIKRKDAGVYGTDNILQQALREAEKRAGGRNLSKSSVRTQDKPYLLADHHRAALLSGRTGDDDGDDSYQQPLTNVQSARVVREEAINAFKSLADSEDEGSEGDTEEEEESGFTLKKRRKGEKQAEDEDEEYRTFLLEMGGGEDEVRKILGMGDQSAWHGSSFDHEEPVAGPSTTSSKKKTKDVISTAEKEELRQNKVKSDDDFLMNYILDRGWIDKTSSHVPTYDEVVGKPSKRVADAVDDDHDEYAAEGSHPWGVLDEDDFDEKAEEFETAYNFRFEEPGATDIITHPRNIDDAVRRKDDARKAKRQAKAERKAAEKAAAEEQTRKLKGQKRREMEAQMKALKKELGDSVDMDGLEKIFEGDFDESEWDRVVGQMLEKAAEAEDDDKPMWDDGDDGGMGQDDYDEVDNEMGQNYGVEDDVEEPYDEGPINMDADFADEEPKKRKKDKKKGKEREHEPEVKPDLSAAERAENIKQAMDEYNALDHEDMIGDLPTKFHYTASAPVHFGLTPVEMLLATDAELNALAGVKFIAPYRRGGLGRTGKDLGKRVRDLKARLQDRRWGEDPDSAPQAKPSGSGANAMRGDGQKRKWGENDKIKQEAAGAAGNGSAGAQPNGPNGEKRKTKRLGKKQREKAKAALASAEGGATEPVKTEPVKGIQDGALAPEPEVQGEEKKKKRRKVKKSERAA